MYETNCPATPTPTCCTAMQAFSQLHPPCEVCEIGCPAPRTHLLHNNARVLPVAAEGVRPRSNGAGGQRDGTLPTVAQQRVAQVEVFDGVCSSGRGAGGGGLV